jgi:hypothetical protein
MQFVCLLSQFGSAVRQRTLAVNGIEHAQFKYESAKILHIPLMCFAIFIFEM